jgi:hypothetical protein
MIELYRVRNNGAYPSTFASGTWGDPAGTTAATLGLRGPDYLRSDPVNPRTNSKTIVAGTTDLGGAATDGWIWDNATGTIFARGWDETNKVWH